MIKTNIKVEFNRITELLFGDFFKEHKGFIELRFINNKANRSISEFYKYGGFNDEDVKYILRMNKNHNVYFSANPRPVSKKKKQDDIKNLVCLWVDLDGKDFQNGKKEALKGIKKFSLKPNVIVDSGNGYHCYWILKEPIPIINKEKKLEFKRILSGVIKELNADKQAINLDRVMRLPGTMNIKKEVPLECRIISSNTGRLYALSDFKKFQDSNYRESDYDPENMPDFGSKELFVNNESSTKAKEDVEKLEVSSKYKKMIITGALQTEEHADKTRSGRDYSIICALIYSDYNYATFRSIFLNQHLGCSDRIISKGEGQLKYEATKALKYVEKRKSHLTKEQQAVLDIKLAEGMKVEQKRLAINQFITNDLIIGEKPIGCAYRDAGRKLFYFFDSSEKLLMDIEGIDFYCFLRDRYRIGKKEKEEIIDAVRTQIWKTGQEIEAYKLAYFDNRNYVLYVSDHNNGIFRVDGERIEHIDNGTDGVFFEFNSEFSPFSVDLKNLKVTNYFLRGKRRRKTVGPLVFSKGWEILGFSFSKFLEEPSYLREFLIERTNFAYENTQDLNEAEQGMLLVIYFYSLFFESNLTEKPIICFLGNKESGKSFIATSIGKILFGDRFQSRYIPDNLNDLRTIIGENYYMVFDNIDHGLKYDVIDVLCIAATGGTVEKRKLYTDHDVVRIRPRIFLVITTREAKFRRDDLVSRLLLFNTKKIDRPKSKSILFRDIRDNRDKIIGEVLVNLNSIVSLLKAQQRYNPDCVSRIADWEMFGRKVAVGFPWGMLFRMTMERMNEEKGKFGLEDDYLYFLLKHRVYEKFKPIYDVSASKLHAMLSELADELKIVDFHRVYKSPYSLGRRISNIKEELERVFEFEINPGAHNVKLYSFEPKFYSDENEKEEKPMRERIKRITKRARRKSNMSASKKDEVDSKSKSPEEDNQ